MTSIASFFNSHWRKLLGVIAIGILGYLLWFHGISNFLPGYSQAEIQTQAASMNLKTIWENPIDLPFKILVWAAAKLGHHSVLVLRVLSAVFGIASAIIFYFVLNVFYTRRVALMSTLLFIFSSGFLHTSHIGSTQILLIFAIIMLLALFPAYYLFKGKNLPVYVSAAVVAVLCYIPGVLWFVVLGLLLLRRKIFRKYRLLQPMHQTLSGGLFVLLLVPLIVACLAKPDLLLHVLGLPTSLPTLAEVGDRLLGLVYSAFWRGSGQPDLMLVGAPLLSFAEATLVIMGVFVQFIRPRTKANALLVAATLLLLALVIVGGVISYTALAPLFGVMMAAGLFYMINMWARVFPRNPVAHAAGAILVVLLIIVSVVYHFRAFYVGWPHAKTTHEVFSHPQPVK